MENKKEKGLLLTWKPEVSVWDYEKVYSEIQNGKKVKTTGWRTRTLQEVKIGMEVFIMKLGEEPKGIIAHGHVVKGPYLENETYYVDIEFDGIQNANDEKEIISLAELKNKFKSKTWDSQGDAVGSYIDETILPELKEMWSKLINGEKNTETPNGGDEGENMKNEFDKNVIFYGSPGTGKTYTTAKRAVEICKTESEEDLIDYSEIMEKYNELKKKNRIEFITFHQSYGYEEFIEGIKPIVLNEDDESEDESENNQESKTNIKIENDIKYDIVDGIFKKFCDNARKAIIETDNNNDNNDIPLEAIVWKVTVRDEVREDCFNNNRVRIDWNFDDAGAVGFVEEVKKGDIIITTDGSRTKINGIAVVTDDKGYTLDKEERDTTTRNVKWLAKNINENIKNINKEKMLHRRTVARVPNMKVEDIIKLAKEKNQKELSKIVIKENKEPYVFIIDEINRGNISKIFGELDDIDAYLVGGISSAIQTNQDLYRQNSDIDIMCKEEDLPKIIKKIQEIGYSIEDKRGIKTNNIIDVNGNFKAGSHDINTSIKNSNLLGVGLFVYKIKNNEVIIYSYTFDERIGRFVGTEKVIPKELFDMIYNNTPVDYK